MSAVLVTVAADTWRMDLVLPGGLPVATLGAELASGFGLEAGTVRLTRLGATLSPDLDLDSQGVEDGAVLWLAPADVPPPRVYDDAGAALAELAGGVRVPRWLQWLVLTRAERRQGDGAVDLPRLGLELRVLARAQLVVLVLLVAAGLSATVATLR